MKYPFLIFILLTVFFSCKKSTVTDTAPNHKNDLVASFSEFMRGFPNQHTVVDFDYDQNQQLASIHLHKYDTSGGIPYMDSSLITFTVADQSTAPPAYDITWMIGTLNPHEIFTEHHILEYDDQKRIIKDSMASSTAYEPYTANDPYNIKYSYSSGNVIMEELYPDLQSPDGYSHGRLDTLFLADGNLIKRTRYLESSGFDMLGHYIIDQQFAESDTYLYSADTNPLYQADLANSLGALLRYKEIGDFISSNLMSQWQISTPSNQTPPPISYSWSADESGRITQGLGTSQVLGTTQNADAFAFRYQ